MSATNTGNIAKLLWPGLNAIWGEYKDHQMEYKDLFTTQSSEKAYEEDQLIPGLGLAPQKSEGAAVVYDTLSQGITSRYTNLAYSLGFVLTREALDDNQYKGKALKAMKMLARSFRQTKETVGANVYNRGHTSGYVGGDGVVLFSTAHPTLSGNQSNRLTTAADLSESSLEDLAIQIGNAVDERGLKIKLTPKSLHIPTASQFEAARILKSLGQSGTANNDINALRSIGIFSDGAKINHYFDDPDAFYVRTDAEQGLTHFERTAPEFAQDNDFDTSNLKYKGYERNSFGWSDFRGAYSNGGGA
jgi:hypothetical protein